MPNLNLTLKPYGTGLWTLSGDLNAVAQLHGAGYYTLTGDIAGTLTLRGDNTAQLTGTSVNANYSGAVNLSFSLNGYNQVSVSGTIGINQIATTFYWFNAGYATTNPTGVTSVLYNSAINYNQTGVTYNG